MTRSFLQHTSVYLYEHKIIERRETDFLPRIQDFTVKIISSNQEANDLVADGLEDFRLYVFYGKEALDLGAIAFCIYVDKALAHVGWAAFSEKGKAHIDPLPFHVAFSAGEACTGGTRTIARFEGKGLMTYGYYLRLEYFRKKGIVASKNSVATDNIASQKVHAKFNPKIYAQARYIRIFGLQFWKERPFK